jgi:hypothetical protein
MPRGVRADAHCRPQCHTAAARSGGRDAPMPASSSALASADGGCGCAASPGGDVGGGRVVCVRLASPPAPPRIACAEPPAPASAAGLAPVRMAGGRAACAAACIVGGTWGDGSLAQAAAGRGARRDGAARGCRRLLDASRRLLEGRDVSLPAQRASRRVAGEGPARDAVPFLPSFLRRWLRPRAMSSRPPSCWAARFGFSTRGGTPK